MMHRSPARAMSVKDIEQIVQIIECLANVIPDRPLLSLPLFAARRAVFGKMLVVSLRMMRNRGLAPRSGSLFMPFHHRLQSFQPCDCGPAPVAEQPRPGLCRKSGACPTIAARDDLDVVGRLRHSRNIGNTPPNHQISSKIGSFHSGHRATGMYVPVFARQVHRKGEK